ncbi:alginate export family protein [Rubritalea sp.]|uniref:alginate export family protein n=1 Tax=Rubritalea sp. TaxID=2109375 RepID=UPI003EF7F0EB
MNKRTLLSLLALTQTAVIAGEVQEIPVVEKPKEEWFKFSVDARARLEQRKIQGLDNSWAGTFRIRPGFFVGKSEGFGAFVETESTLAFIDDYASAQPQLNPNTPGNTRIDDPENNELNQLYAQYIGYGALLRGGRQRIIYDNAAFIGNVGWRQNEQTMDGALLDYKKDAFTFKYSYVNRVNRIFGADALGAARALKGAAHFVNGSYKFGENKFTAYTYLMDFDELSFSRASNNTYGGFFDFALGEGSLHTEFAYQTEAGNNEADYGDYYAHVFYGGKASILDYNVGVEYLGDEFVTPLATVHKFNGFADRFAGNRLGLAPAAAWNGLSDVYASAGTKIAGGVVLTGFVHAFWDQDFDQFYGFEFDATAVKKFNDNFKAVAKYAYYFGNNDDSDYVAFEDNISQFSVELNYTF